MRHGWLEGLAAKYDALLALCRERDAYEAAGVFSLTDAARRERFARTRAVAERFPGALRELDHATVAGLEVRRAAIGEEVARDRARDRAPLWMRVVDDFHTSLAELLAVKRRMAMGQAVSDEERARVHAPPYGRLQELVWSALAQRYAMAPERLRAIVHHGENGET